MEVKKCNRCNDYKSISEFNKDSGKKDQLRLYCRLCDNQSCLQWNKNNRERLNKYTRDKRANDSSFRLAHNLRKRLGQALLKQCTRKNNKTEELLGISFKEFKEYIEFLMTPKMTWSTIELDHVRPLSSFNLTDSNQLKEAAHYTNIQPLLKSDNRKKGSKYHEHDLVVQNEKVYEYHYFKYYNLI